MMPDRDKILNEIGLPSSRRAIRTKLILIGLLAALILTSPLLLIWSLNTLFRFGIGYGICEYLACLILMYILCFILNPLFRVTINKEV